MAKEEWDLYTADRRLTGLKHTRGEPIPDDLVVHVWIRSRGGKYLMSRRSASRPEYPLMWECTGGSALSGEDSISAALREAREEIGVELPSECGRLLFSEAGRVVNGVKCRDIIDVWLFDYDGDANLSAATTDEVSETAWMSSEQISELFTSGKIVGSLGYFFTRVDN